MAAGDFHFLYSDIASTPCSDIYGLLSKCSKVRIGDLRILQLEQLGGKKTNGVYVFFDKYYKSIYVGKCSSRSFVERIPSHFDSREDSWFGTLIKKYSEIKKISREQAVIHSADFMLLLICLDYKDCKISALEKALQIILKSELNKIRKRSIDFTGMTLGSVVDAFVNEDCKNAQRRKRA